MLHALGDTILELALYIEIKCSFDTITRSHHFFVAILFAQLVDHHLNKMWRSLIFF